MNSPSLASSEELKETTCQHYWIIDVPNGPTSIGRCRKCGTQREFQNIVDAPDNWLVPSGGSMPLTDADLDLLHCKDFSPSEN